jgi:hypothetical protein
LPHSHARASAANFCAPLDKHRSIERFHQTLKRYLAKQDHPRSRKQLQRQLDRFSHIYNELRPHKALQRHTPLEAFNAKEKAFPKGPLIDASGYRVRHDKVDKAGRVTLRYRGRLYHIGVGRPYCGWRVVILVAGREIRIIGIDGAPLRRLTLDPSIDYQRQT